MNIISISDFKGRVLLPQQGNPTMVIIYNDLISRYQEKALIDIFGYAFYNELKTAYDNSELEENPIALDAKWSNLVNGAEITINETLYKYNGLKDILTRYIFAYFIIENHISTNTNSISTPTIEDGKGSHSAVYLGVVWNEMLSMLPSVYDYIDEVGTYPDYIHHELEAQSWL